MSEQEPKLVTVTIDGTEHRVPAGANLLQTILDRKIDVPYYCYHPKLTVAGNCRMCMVEVEKVPRMLTACSTTCTDGMVVRTQTAQAREARARNMELLLINHPLDCPICDQAGECMLQDYAYRHGRATSRFVEEKVHQAKRVELGSGIVLDQERCIVCTRCVRFSQEVSGTHGLGVFARGDRSYIGTPPGLPYEDPYAGNTVDICPVGALTSQDFRFQTRTWFMKRVPGVCPHCSRGCNVQIDYRPTGGIDRCKPRANEAVNQCWMCDQGRYGFHHWTEEGRVTQPLARDGDGWTPLTPEAALARLRERAAGGVAAVTDAWPSLEELAALAAWVGVGQVAVVTQADGPEDDLLLRTDKAPNAAGARLLGLGAGTRTPEGACLLIVESDPLGKGVLYQQLEDRRRTAAFVVVLTPFAAAHYPEADLVLPLAHWAEKDGLYVNFQQRCQQSRAALTPPGAARPLWWWATRMTDAPLASAREVYEQVVRAHAPFRETGYGEIGDQGLVLGGDGPTSPEERP